MKKYMATMVENFSDGDRENGICSPSTFDDLIEATSYYEAEMKANSKWTECGCVFVREATPQDIEEYEMLMAM